MNTSLSLKCQFQNSNAKKINVMMLEGKLKEKTTQNSNDKQKKKNKK